MLKIKIFLGTQVQRLRILLFEFCMMCEFFSIKSLKKFILGFFIALIDLWVAEITTKICGNNK